jgi:hypothetical protein
MVTLGNPCGIFRLTHAAELALHPIGRLPRLPAAQTTQKPLKLQQVCDAEQCAPSADDGLRVRGDEVRPLAGNRAYRHLVNLQQESPAVTVIPLAHADKRLPPEWMEGMCHTYKTRRSDRKVCILD